MTASTNETFEIFLEFANIPEGWFIKPIMAHDIASSRNNLLIHFLNIITLVYLAIKHQKISTDASFLILVIFDFLVCIKWSIERETFFTSGTVNSFIEVVYFTMYNCLFPLRVVFGYIQIWRFFMLIIFYFYPNRLFLSLLILTWQKHWTWLHLLIWFLIEFMVDAFLLPSFTISLFHWFLR